MLIHAASAACMSMHAASAAWAVNGQLSDVVVFKSVFPGVARRSSVC